MIFGTILYTFIIILMMVIILLCLYGIYDMFKEKKFYFFRTICCVLGYGFFCICVYALCILPSNDISEVIKITDNTETHRCYNLFRTTYEDKVTYKDRDISGKVIGLESEKHYVKVTIQTEDGYISKYDISGEINMSNLQNVKVHKYYWPNIRYEFMNTYNNL